MPSTRVVSHFSVAVNFWPSFAILNKVQGQKDTLFPIAIHQHEWVDERKA